jgi:hypothetical protein
MIINNFGGWLNYPDYFFFYAYHGQDATFNGSSYKNPEMDKRSKRPWRRNRVSQNTKKT